MKKIINLPKGTDIICDSSDYCNETNGDKISDWIDIEVEKFVDHRNGKLKNDVIIKIMVEAVEESEEKPYPAGHCWEGLTPSQVSEAYNKLDKKEKNEKNI